MTKIENSYCVPNNRQWHELIGYAPDCDTVICAVYDAEMGILDANVDEVKCLTEIPVPRFLDLLHDRIVPWRVEELGGQRYGNERFYTINMPEHRCVLVHFEERVIVDARQLDKGLHIPNITTFTDLLTLIRMLTPPTEQK